MGHLFGEMDPHQAMNLDPNEYLEESNHVSLGLLEWKRRQQWDPATNKAKPMLQTYPKGMRCLPPRLAEEGMSAEIPLWEAVNPIPGVQRQPATAEPPRRRHSDAKYADWINTMINVLSGSGRSWALHEFFYSDIDRAWYVSCEIIDVILVLLEFDSVAISAGCLGLISINSKWM